jgi:hypothetical protein
MTRSRAASISLSVKNWSAYAPGVTDRAGWQAWAKDDIAISGPVEPDVKFVAPMMRRRLSSLSRMAFRVAADCLEDDTGSPTFVLCSRYGEYARSYGILENIAAGNPPSAAAFSMSVHNTANSLFSIETKNRSASTALAGGEATLETGFLEAWSLLINRTASSVLLIYLDERLPALYQAQKSTVSHDGAIAMLLKLPDDAAGGIGLDLAWTKRESSTTIACDAVADPAMQVLKLLVNGEGSFDLDAERLVWTWNARYGAT